MARLPRLFRTRAWVHGKNPLATDVESFRVVFIFYVENGILCVLNTIASMRRF